jgi:uncharacterized membrane protein
MPIYIIENSSRKTMVVLPIIWDLIPELLNLWRKQENRKKWLNIIIMTISHIIFFCYTNYAVSDLILFSTYSTTFIVRKIYTQTWWIAISFLQKHMEQQFHLQLTSFYPPPSPMNPCYLKCCFHDLLLQE